jgi:hypothetical protein
MIMSRKYGSKWKDNIKVDLKRNKTVNVWIGFKWLRIGASGGLMYEHRYEPSGISFYMSPFET